MEKVFEFNPYIVANPTICHGQPTFKGTRVMVWQVLDLLGAGVTVDEILQDYFPQLTREAIFAALQYASHAVEEEEYAAFPQTLAPAVR